MDIKEIAKRIQLMVTTADELMQMGEDFPALYRNTKRIRASLKMLEINVSDVAALEGDEKAK
ncbi:MAG: hypothetical protein BWK80_00520 [Desulfobacteraceae bacterium IS3]|nr:MAG: hypothetical protein BWK80_00520 [Desulfobacteraceae bacterium IS3]